MERNHYNSTDTHTPQSDFDETQVLAWGKLI